MSSTVKWGGIAGVVAAALLVLSAILDQLSPSRRRMTPPPVISILPRIRCIRRSAGCAAGHSRSAPRKAAVRALGHCRDGADLCRLRDRCRCHGDQHGAGTAISPNRSDRRRTGIARWLCTSRCDHLRAKLLPWWCGVLLIVAFPLGDRANAIFGSAEYLLLALLWGSMGIALLVRREKVPEPAVTQPA